MNIRIGDSVRWSCMAGVKTGVVKNIHLAPARDSSVQPWITLEYNITRDGTVKAAACLCASDTNLKIMQVEKI